MALTIWQSELCTHDAELDTTREILVEMLQPYLIMAGRDGQLMDAHVVLQANVEGEGTDLLLFLPNVTLVMELKHVGRNVSVTATSNDWTKTYPWGEEKLFEESPYKQVRKQIGCLLNLWKRTAKGTRLPRIEGVVVISSNDSSGVEDNGFDELEHLRPPMNIYVRRLENLNELLGTILNPRFQRIQFTEDQKNRIVDFISNVLGIKQKACLTERGYVPESEVGSGVYTKEEEKAVKAKRVDTEKRESDRKVREAKEAADRGIEAERRRPLWCKIKERLSCAGVGAVIGGLVVAGGVAYWRARDN